MQNLALFALLLAAGALAPGVALGQRPVELAMRGGPQPHFVAAWAPEKEREADRSAALAGRVSLELGNVSLDEALKTLTNEAGLNITYSPAVLPAGKRVTIKAGDIAVVTALTEMLFRSGLDVVVDQDGALALVPCKHAEARAEVQDSGTIVGTVTDKATGAPIVGATVVVEGTNRSATTGGEGSYRIEGVEPGTHTVRARYIGYASLTVDVVVPEGGEVTADFGLVKSTQRLDELVTVTPGGMQTQAKALPTPVTVITAEDIERQRSPTLASVFRQAVPSAVAVNPPGQPTFTSLSTRGASSLSGLGTMKVFVDGVEASSYATSAVDPASIERIEVIRGPQAATVYGADAAGGVVQITTKRGDPASAQPQVELQALGGALQTPYDGVDHAFRQQYTASVRGRDRDVSYNLGAGYTRLGDWLPNGEISRQSTPSVYGSMRYATGIIAADLDARYFRNNLASSLNPDFQTAGFPFYSRPFFTPDIHTNETYGLRVSVTPNSWWRHQLTLGADRFEQDQRQARPRLTTPADTLLQIFDDVRRKASLFFNSAVAGSLGANFAGTLTAGIDYYRLDATTFLTTQALNTEGTIQTDPPGAFTNSRGTATNTGYFAQAEANWQETIFLTAGLRADDNSSIGKDVSTPVLPRVGLSVVRQFGDVTVKVRGAYGRAMRAPSPGAAFGQPGAALIVLPNASLQPERQRGWDGGVDLVFGSRGSLSVTGFTQMADDLIAFLLVGVSPALTFQWQNVGRVLNRGVELEGTWSVGPAQVKGQYAYVQSIIRELGPGDSQVEVGDQPVNAPAHTAGASATVAPWEGTMLSAGVTYVGSARRPDNLALVQCFGGTGPCQPTPRGYIKEYPGFAKVNLAITQRLTPQFEAVVNVDNLTNNFAYEADNSFTVMGRTTMVGLRARL